jgi:hypothetical protein
MTADASVLPLACCSSSSGHTGNSGRPTREPAGSTRCLRLAVVQRVAVQRVAVHRVDDPCSPV